MIIIILVSLLWGAAPVSGPMEQIPDIKLRLRKFAMLPAVIVPPLRAVPGTTNVYRKFIPPTVVRANNQDLAEQYAQALSVTDIGVVPKAHNGGMVALYKGYKVFLADCNQFISSAADELIALFNQYVLRDPGPFPTEEHLTEDVKTELLAQLEQAKMEMLFGDLTDESDNDPKPDLLKVLGGFSIMDPDLKKRVPSPPSGGEAKVEYVGARNQLEVRLAREEAALYQEGIIRTPGWSFPWDDNRPIVVEARVQQSQQTKINRTVLFDKIRNSPQRRLTDQDIEFIEQTVVSPHTNLETVYCIAAKLVQDLTSLEGEEFERDLCQEKIAAKEKMIDLLKSFFGRTIATQIIRIMFEEE